MLYLRTHAVEYGSIPLTALLPKLDKPAAILKVFQTLIKDAVPFGSDKGQRTSCPLFSYLLYLWTGRVSPSGSIPLVFVHSLSKSFLHAYLSEISLTFFPINIFNSVCGSFRRLRCPRPRPDAHQGARGPGGRSQPVPSH